jgi:DnaK suppressor protein
MPLTEHHRHYFTIEQRETLERLLQARAAVLRGEIGTDAQENLNAEPEMAALQRDIDELRDVESALARLHEPGFGLCEDCSAEIPYVRLKTNPAARRCVGCQAKRELAGSHSPP